MQVIYFDVEFRMHRVNPGLIRNGKEQGCEPIQSLASLPEYHMDLEKKIDVE
jgi:hypothetical protein